MTTLHKNFTKFASLMVAFGLMLGLAVTGCSDKDSDGGRVAEMANIAYNFAQLAGVTPKATEDAVAVVMTAFDADGKAVVAEQETSIIAEHKDVTPAELVGSKVYEGVAQVDTTAVKLVLTYLNADGDEMSSDVVNNVTVKDGAVIDFTNSEPEPTSGVTWNPADNKIKIAVGEVVPISATDVDGNLLDLYGDESAEGYLDYVEDPVGIIGIAPTPEGEPVILTLNALNEAGEVLDTKVYEITVTGEPAPAIVWNPAEAAQEMVVGKDMTITANNGDEEAPVDYTVTLAIADGETHVSVAGNVVTAVGATETGKPATVTATATNENGDEVGTMTYKITVVAAPAIVWQPAEAAQEMVVGDKLFIAANNGDEESPFYYLVTLDIDASVTQVTVAGNEVIAWEATAEPVTVTATAKDAEGNVVGTMTYKITVVAAPVVVWNPAEAAQEMVVGKDMTITANNGDEEAPVDYTVTLAIADGETHVSVAGNVVTAVGATETGKPVTVTATATDKNGVEVGTMEYAITVKATPAPVVVWTPADSNQTLNTIIGDPLEISAISEAGAAYLVELATDDKDEVHIYLEFFRVFPHDITEAGKPVTVTATAYDDNGVKVGTKVYNITVVDD